MSTASGPIDSAKTLIGRRPAETATAAAGAVGLLLANLFDGGDDLKTGLVVLLASLPAFVSYVYELGRPKRLPHNLAKEIDELALRSVRRARVGHEGWAADLDRATQLTTLWKSLSPPTLGAPTQDATPKTSEKKEKPSG